MDELTHAIYNSFDNNQNPPNILDLDRSFLEYWEIREFLSKLSKNKWQDIVELDSFFSISKDAEIWTGYMPPEWFPYYLPAFLLITHKHHESFFKNLRGYLIGYLELDKYSNNRCQLIYYLLQNVLSDEQKKTIKIYLDLYR
ncbi:MAG: hypothetical protein H6974_14935 [Gammaproteobacteria bacterium]|nr:hypothetical protein [Gammaproteobacteria bacterium]